jgi:hypothetical protein
LLLQECEQNFCDSFRGVNGCLQNGHVFAASLPVDFRAAETGMRVLGRSGFGAVGNATCVGGEVWWLAWRNSGIVMPSVAKTAAVTVYAVKPVASATSFTERPRRRSDLILAASSELY